jgi:glycosyltransferase involved in cell wall biosynthesis
MRITVVIGPFFPMPPAPTGAIEKVWHKLCETFAARGHEVTVLCPRSDSDGDDETIRGVRYRRFRRWHRTGSTKLDLVKDLLHSIRMLTALPEADVTVTNSFWLPALLRLARRRRVGALNIHAQRFPKRQFGLYRGADRVSTVSEAIASAIREQTPAIALVIRIIPNPVDIDVFTPEGPTERTPGARTILFTGRVHPEKGLDLLVKAYVRLRRDRPDLTLRLVGPTEVPRGGGGPQFVESLKTLAGGAPLDFVANIADPVALARTLRSCDVYCYPSVAFFGEASPVAPLEAMACGAVTVVSDLPQFAGYVTEGVTGLTFPREAPDADVQLASRLAAVLDDATFAARIREAGVAKARSLSVSRVAELHLEDFRELVEARQRGSNRSA